MVRIRSLHHASIMVRDLPRAKAFYCDVLGLEALPRPERPIQGLWLSAGGQQVHVIVGEVGAVPLTDSRKELEAKGLAGHFALEVEDVRSAAETLAEKGHPPLGPMISRPDGSASVFVRDPDGNLVELIQPRA